jgi:copper transporter 1
MDMSSSSMMGMEDMAMTFFTSTTTPLFSKAWTPNGAGQYAGTCIFLVALATIFRSLLAIRLNLFKFLAVATRQRKEDATYGYGENNAAEIRSWRANEAVWIAGMDVVLSGVAYLLSVLHLLTRVEGD